jgi:RNase P subunit RPR2
MSTIFERAMCNLCPSYTFWINGKSKNGFPIKDQELIIQCQECGAIKILERHKPKEEEG